MATLPPIRLHNTLTRRTEPLVPLEPGRVGIYTCGSTVYKYAHIGNLRTYLFGDLLHRTLEYLGYEVRYVKNITDVGHMRDDQLDAIDGEDKIERAAETEGKSPMEIADFYTEAWLEDEALLNILPRRRHAEGDRAHRRDGVAHGAAARERPRLRGRRHDLLRRQRVPRPTASSPGRRSRRRTPAIASRSSPTSATRPTSRSGSARASGG